MYSKKESVPPGSNRSPQHAEDVADVVGGEVVQRQPGDHGVILLARRELFHRRLQTWARLATLESWLAMEPPAKTFAKLGFDSTR